MRIPILLLACFTTVTWLRAAVDSNHSPASKELIDARTLHAPISGFQLRKMDFSRDGKELVTGWPGQAGQVAQIWDVPSGTELRRLTLAHPLKGSAYMAGATHVVFSPDDKQILSGTIDYWKGKAIPKRADQITNDGESHLFNAKTGREIRTFKSAQGGGVGFPMFSPDGKLAIMRSQDSAISIWEIKTGRELRRFKPAEEGEGIGGTSFSPDGKRIALAVQGLMIIDARTGEVIAHHKTRYVSRSVMFSSDGDEIAVADVDSVWLWNCKKKQPGPVIATGAVFSGALFSSDGRQIITTETHDLAKPSFSVVRVIDLKTGIEGAHKRFSGTLDFGLAATPDGSWIAVSTSDGDIHILRGVHRR